jgi:eukaryotic-like serine/threonine-protein kinase
VRTLGHSISPDGTTVAAIPPDQSVALYRVADGVSTAVRGLVAGEIRIRWSADGKSLYVFRLSDLPARVYRLDLSTGRRELWKEFLLADRTGITFIPRIQLTADGKSYVYSYTRTLSELYLVDGLK